MHFKTSWQNRLGFSPHVEPRRGNGFRTFRTVPSPHLIAAALRVCELGGNADTSKWARAGVACCEVWGIFHSPESGRFSWL